MATHSNTLAWKIQWAEEPDGLQSMGCKESDITEQPGSPCHLKSEIIGCKEQDAGGNLLHYSDRNKR